jgi:hypothetical protein
MPNILKFHKGKYTYKFSMNCSTYIVIPFFSTNLALVETKRIKVCVAETSCNTLLLCNLWHADVSVYYFTKKVPVPVPVAVPVPVPVSVPVPASASVRVCQCQFQNVGIQTFSHVVRFRNQTESMQQEQSITHRRVPIFYGKERSAKNTNSLL